MSDTPLPLDSGDFRLMDRRVLDALGSMREENRYVRGMVSWVGFDQVPLEYARQPRHSGESGYTMSRLLRLALDGILSFSSKPLELVMRFGMLVTALAFIYGVYLILERIIDPASAPEGWTTVIVAVLFIGGVQLISVGVLGAYLGRIFYETKRRPLYVVAETLNLEVRRGE
jgi:dolichol-phosphate mannosyltransferase